MCGILFGYEKNQETLRLRASAALDSMSHRGPDAKQLVGVDGCVLGHVRLSIIDISGSDQPMADPKNRFYLVFNGEIYNYRKLREDLESRWSFRTCGDTEVVLAGLVLEGNAFLQKMNGMWAVALWDSLEMRLFLARDRFGKKPLFYSSVSPNEFFAASEILPLRKIMNSRATESQASLASFMRYGFFMPGQSCFAEIFEVLPGHYLEWMPGGCIKHTEYWKLQVAKVKTNKREAVENIRALVCDAVKRRMVSDVEVGAFLSGGIDSSLIVSIMMKDLGLDFKTFTVAFSEKSYDESVYAKKMAAYIGSEHFEGVYRPDVRNDIEKLLINHIGQPFGDPSVIPTYQLSKIAANSVKVVLSGDGGDEVFCGYQRYRARLLMKMYGRLPLALRRAYEYFIRKFPEPMHHHSSSFLKKAQLFADIAGEERKGSGYVAPVFMNEQEWHGLFPDLDFAASFFVEKNQSYIDSVEKVMREDMRVYLPQDILQKVDRASMAAALEVRSPFLDYNVVDYVYSLPVEWHQGVWGGKRLLKEAFQDYLPVEIWNRKKQGFAVPLQHLMANELGDELWSLANDITLPLSTSKLGELLTLHRQGLRDVSFQLWFVYVYAVWKKNLTVDV